jgi:hypothetical protein
LEQHVCIAAEDRPRFTFKLLAILRSFCPTFVQAHNTTLLKFMPNEDVSIGFWLMSVDLRRIDNQRVMPPDRCFRVCQSLQLREMCGPILSTWLVSR